MGWGEGEGEVEGEEHSEVQQSISATRRDYPQCRDNQRHVEQRYEEQLATPEMQDAGCSMQDAAASRIGDRRAYAEAARSLSE